MRLIIKDESSKGANGARGTNGVAARNGGNGVNIKPPAGRSRSQQRNRPLVSTAFRTLDSTARALGEAVLQVLSGVRPYVPSIQVRESRDSIIVNGYLPSVDGGSVQVVFDGHSLRIHGAKTLQQEQVRRRYRRVETVSRTFERAIPLYCDVESTRIVATLRDDLLSIHVPKKAAATVPARRTLEAEAVGVG